MGESGRFDGFQGRRNIQRSPQPRIFEGRRADAGDALVEDEVAAEIVAIETMLGDFRHRLRNFQGAGQSAADGKCGVAEFLQVIRKAESARETGAAGEGTDADDRDPVRNDQLSDESAVSESSGASWPRLFRRPNPRNAARR